MNLTRLYTLRARLGGYALIEAGSRAKVIEVTKRFLEVAGQGTCEIHQLYEMPPA